MNADDDYDLWRRLIDRVEERIDILAYAGLFLVEQDPKLIDILRQKETGKVLRWEFDTEDEARQIVWRLVQVDGGQWREQTGDAVTQPPK